MGRFTEKQLTIMTIVVAVVITGLFAALIYRDVGAMAEEDQKIRTADMNISAAEAEIDKMPERETDVIVFREIVKRDSAILPDESEINEFINIIGEFEKFSGVVVTQVTGLSARGRSKSKAAIIKIPLKLKLRGSFDQFLKFINQFENYARVVNISGFTVSRGNGRDAVGSTQHEIGLEFETYQYDPRGGPVTREEIPNYERRKQELGIQKRIRQAKLVNVGKYLLKPRISRRDPLVDPREAETPVVPDGMTVEQKYKVEKALLEQMKLEVSLLQEDCRVEKKLHEKHDFMRIPAISQAIEQRLQQLEIQISDALSAKKITIPELKDSFVAAVVQPYEEVKMGRAENKTTEIVVDRKTVHNELQKMIAKFEEGEYTSVITVWEGFLQFAEGKKIDPEAEALVTDMEQLAKRAEVIKRFEAEPLKIDGVIIDKSRKSFAIINDRIFAEGDSVDSDGRKILINEIKADQIEFIYEQVPIRKYLRKN